MICKNCGKELPDGLIYCPKCGTKLSIDSTTNETSKQNHPNKHENCSSTPLSFDIEDKFRGHIKNKLAFITFAIEVIAICIVYLSVSNHLKTNSLFNSESTRRVLTVNIDNNDSDENDDYSDMTQISNALQNGGAMTINIPHLEDPFKSKISPYGASDSEGMYYIQGAVLNYIASEGWELIQGPSTGLSNTYYFIK